MIEPDNETETDYLAVWITSLGIQLTGECAFCGKYADLVSTSADDLVCETCYQEFEAALEGDSDG